MDQILYISNKYGIPVVEDACQAVLAEYNGKCAGTFGSTGAFSLHPLKNLNVWGDGGMITTNDPNLYDWIYRYRNHGMVNRDEVAHYGCNSRLDSMQAIVGNYLIQETKVTVAKRRENAAYYDSKLKDVRNVSIIDRRAFVKPCYHLYMFEVSNYFRNRLLKFLVDAEIEAKVHYPIPLQAALRNAGLGRVDFPRAFEQSSRIITLPVDEHITREEQDYCVDKIREFMEAP